MQLYRLPNPPPVVPFSVALGTLPVELQYRIFSYLDTDDLGTLARVVPDLLGLDEETYLKDLFLKKVHTPRSARLKSRLYPRE